MSVNAITRLAAAAVVLLAAGTAGAQQQPSPRHATPTAASHDSATAHAAKAAKTAKMNETAKPRPHRARHAAPKAHASTSTRAPHHP